jgi:hypothetical protein
MRLALLRSLNVHCGRKAASMCWFQRRLESRYGAAPQFQSRTRVFISVHFDNVNNAFQAMNPTSLAVDPTRILCLSRPDHNHDISALMGPKSAPDALTKSIASARPSTPFSPAKGPNLNARNVKSVCLQRDTPRGP